MYNEKDFIEEEVDHFLITTKSKDKCPIIICGYCEKGTVDQVSKSMKKINKYILGSSKDIYGVDYLLASSIMDIANNYIYAIGATIQVENVMEITGGIIGNPKNNTESAGDEIEEIHKNMFVISFPGGPGIVLIGNKEQALYIHSKIISYDHNIEKILPVLEKYLDRFFLITDGSGKNAVGSAYIKNYNKKKHQKL